MKMRRLLAILLTLTMLIGLVPFGGIVAHAQDAGAADSGTANAVLTVYVKSDGDDTAAGTAEATPVASIGKALELIAAASDTTAKIVILDSATLPNAVDTGAKSVIIVGKEATAQLKFGATEDHVLTGDITLDKLTFASNKADVILKDAKLTLGAEIADGEIEEVYMAAEGSTEMSSLFVNNTTEKALIGNLFVGPDSPSGAVDVPGAYMEFYTTSGRCAGAMYLSGRGTKNVNYTDDVTIVANGHLTNTTGVVSSIQAFNNCPNGNHMTAADGVKFVVVDNIYPIELDAPIGFNGQGLTQGDKTVWISNMSTVSGNRVCDACTATGITAPIWLDVTAEDGCAIAPAAKAGKFDVTGNKIAVVTKEGADPIKSVDGVLTLPEPGVYTVTWEDDSSTEVDPPSSGDGSDSGETGGEPDVPGTDGDEDAFDVTMYVSSTGSDDTGDGTFDAPWATLERALHLVSVPPIDDLPSAASVRIVILDSATLPNRVACMDKDVTIVGRNATAQLKFGTEENHTIIGQLTLDKLTFAANNADVVLENATLTLGAEIAGGNIQEVYMASPGSTEMSKLYVNNNLETALIGNLFVGPDSPSTAINVPGAYMEFHTTSGRCAGTMYLSGRSTKGITYTDDVTIVANGHLTNTAGVVSGIQAFNNCPNGNHMTAAPGVKFVVVDNIVPIELDAPIGFNGQGLTANDKSVWILNMSTVSGNRVCDACTATGITAPIWLDVTAEDGCAIAPAAEAGKFDVTGNKIAVVTKEGADPIKSVDGVLTLADAGVYTVTWEADPNATPDTPDTPATPGKYEDKVFKVEFSKYDWTENYQIYAQNVGDTGVFPAELGDKVTISFDYCTMGTSETRFYNACSLSSWDPKADKWTNNPDYWFEVLGAQGEAAKKGHFEWTFTVKESDVKNANGSPRPMRWVWQQIDNSGAEEPTFYDLYFWNFKILVNDSTENWLTPDMDLYSSNGEGNITYEVDIDPDDITPPAVHDWQPATCTIPKTCAVCGATEGDVLGHSWQAATCTSPMTCVRCGVTEGYVLPHNWNNATCTTPKTCTACGITQGVALGHDWDEATCTAPMTCVVCGTTSGRPLGHQWTNSGSTPLTCGKCGLTGSWKQNSTGWWYEQADGSYVANRWMSIGGYWYYFNRSGYMQVGWVQIGGKWYYMNASGKMQTGWQTIADRTYYLGFDGVMQIGWASLDGKRYYFDENGVVQTGWLSLDGKQYYLGAGGAMQTGWQTIGGKRYYFGTSGAMQFGWLRVDGKQYYLDDTGVVQIGWQSLDGRQYYFATDGKMLTGWQQIGGKKYYLGTSGVMQIGWVQLNGSWYYLNTSGVMLTGWQSIDGKQYYLSTNGKMLTGWQTIGGKVYYLGTGGAMQVGWIQINSRWYYANTSGAMQTGWQSVDGKQYYFNTSGVMQVGWQTIGGKKYYLGTSGAMQTGWVQVSGQWYYMNTAGVLQIGWQVIDGKQYCLDANGAMQTGWAEVNSTWYYFGTSGAMQTGWVQVSGYWYYMSDGGSMLTGWQSIDGNWYYMHSGGKMATGWLQLSGTWYYLQSGGKMVTGTVMINGKAEVFTSGGAWLG